MSNPTISQIPTADVGELWRELADPLRGFLRARVRAAADAEDLLQEVFVRIQRRLPELREPAKLQGWVYRIARNVVVDHYRSKKGKDHVLLDAESHASAEAVEGEAIDPAGRDPSGRDVVDLTPSLRSFIAALPDEYREPLVRHAFQGQSIEEVATALGLTVTATKSRVRRARLKLREMLDACCRFEFDRRGRVIEAVRKRPARVACACE